MELKQRDNNLVGVLQKLNTDEKEEIANAWMKVEKAMLELQKCLHPLYPLNKVAEKLLLFLDKQGEIKKADEQFITNVIKTAKENGVNELTLKFDKGQLAGLDTTIKKVKRNAGFDLDIGIKGETNVELHIKFK